MSKVTVYLIGGLGNNLFQMSYAENLKKDYDKVVFNTYLQKKNVLTKFLGWTIHPNEIIDSMLQEEIVCDTFNFLDFFYVLCIFFLAKTRIVDLSDSNKNKCFLNRVIGYWQQNVQQSTPFLEKLKFLALALKTKSDISKQINRNIIHVRRGDFDEKIQISMDYYKDAIEACGLNNFVVVTNDRSVISEFSSLFPDVSFELSIGGSQIDDFVIMTNASLMITSNSTFSYWASQIEPVPIVYYPRKISCIKPWNYNLSNDVQVAVDSFRAK